MRVFISTHGKMSSGVKSTASVLLGSTDDIFVYDAYVDKEDLLLEKFHSYLDSLEADEVAIVLTDINGGSINIRLTQEIENIDRKVYLISGFNFPLLIQLQLHEGEINDEIIENYISSSRNAMQLVVLDDIVEEDFF